MISLVLTLALTLLSFISSAFVLLRILTPILPPNPLSRRVPPSEFGLPNYRSLSPADKSHLWLTCLDLFALGFFVWQAVTTNLLSSTNITHDPLSVARLWIALTTRQTCLLFVAGLSLLYVRLGRSVSFGPKHCLLWAPVLIFVATGTGVGVVLAEVGFTTVWGGIVAYSATISMLTTVCFGCLVGTLLLIRHNIKVAARAEIEEKEWPPLKEKLTRRSIAIEDIEALKEGSSWITSHRSSGGSPRNSISAFSFSTTHQSQQGTTAPITGSAPSVLPKSSYWFGTATPNSAAMISQDSIPPVPRVPSPYRDHSATPPAHQVYGDIPADPFHRSPPRPSKSSANSWLTSPSVSQVTLTEFSFPTTRPSSPNEHEQLTRTAMTPTAYEQRTSHSNSRAAVQPLSESQVLGGYGRQNGIVGLSPKASKDIEISVFRCVVWFATIWIPLGLSLPYLLLSSSSHDFSSPLASILLTISVTLSSPLLALNLLLRSPLPIPATLFSPTYSPRKLSETSPISEIRIHPEMRGRSSSMTVVEGRRSGDVWISNGEAVEGRSKAARILGLLAPTPQLAVLPLADNEHDAEQLTPPLPIQEEGTPSVAMSSPSANSAEMGAARTRKDSKASSYFSGADESLAYNSRIMIAQRHYSAMATTVIIPPSPKQIPGAGGASRDSRRSSVGNALENTSIATGVQHGITKGHTRSRSASSSLQTPRSSTQHRFPLTPPPASPLPPTPPNVRHLQHSRSQSSSGSGFSFGAIGNANQIDSLSAGVLPLLVPGLKLSNDMVIRDSSSPPRSHRRDEIKKRTPPKDFEFGISSSASFNSPELHSTPARPRKGSGNRWKHLSLPSLGLGKDGIHSLSAWKEELVRVLDGFETKTPQHRRTIHGDKPPVPAVNLQKTSSGTLSPVAEDEYIQFGYAVTSDSLRPTSAQTFGPTPPTSASVYSDGFNTARSSMATMVEVPPNSATALLQPTFQDQQGLTTTSHRRTPSQTETTYKSHAYHLPARKSSIVYIKSDDAVQSNTYAQTTSQKPRAWPTRASVKQPIPGTSKIFSPAADGSGSPLRKLTLLGNRDINSTPTSPSTRPLALSKKAKQADKENSGLRPLKLARSATAKARGLLRQDEVLPDVVVRPPSMSTHAGFGYTFR